MKKNKVKVKVGSKVNRPKKAQNELGLKRTKQLITQLAWEKDHYKQVSEFQAEIIVRLNERLRFQAELIERIEELGLD